jgi:hypothetical protein
MTNPPWGCCAVTCAQRTNTDCLQSGAGAPKGEVSAPQRSSPGSTERLALVVGHWRNRLPVYSVGEGLHGQGPWRSNALANGCFWTGLRLSRRSQTDPEQSIGSSDTSPQSGRPIASDQLRLEALSGSCAAFARPQALRSLVLFMHLRVRGALASVWRRPTLAGLARFHEVAGLWQIDRGEKSQWKRVPHAALSAARKPAPTSRSMSQRLLSICLAAQ